MYNYVSCCDEVTCTILITQFWRHWPGKDFLADTCVTSVNGTACGCPHAGAPGQGAGERD